MALLNEDQLLHYLQSNQSSALTIDPSMTVIELQSILSCQTIYQLLITNINTIYYY